MELPEAQGLRHAMESKSRIPEIFLFVESGILEILMQEYWILGFEIRNPRRRIQYPGLSCIPLHGATRQCTHPTCPAVIIDDFIYLGSVISNEDGSRGDINKVWLGKLVATASRLKCSCILAELLARAKRTRSEHHN